MNSNIMPDPGSRVEKICRRPGLWITVVSNSMPAALSSSAICGQVLDADGDVLDAGAEVLDEAGDLRLGGGPFQQHDGDRAGVEHRRDHRRGLALGPPALLELEPQDVGVEPDRLLEIADGDRDVVDRLGVFGEQRRGLDFIGHINSSGCGFPRERPRVERPCHRGCASHSPPGRLCLTSYHRTGRRCGILEGMADREPALRAILLGASNLKISLPFLLDHVRRRAGGPVEALAACGHGRSYGSWSRFLFVRHLPGIAGCGLWREVERRPPLPTFALVTDVGNDLLYGARAGEIAAWVEACLDRLVSHRPEIVMTLLPLARLERLSARQVRLAASLLFPGRQVAWPGLLDRARDLDARLRRIGGERGARLVEPAADWYGLDPIHLRRRSRREAWTRILPPAPTAAGNPRGHRADPAPRHGGGPPVRGPPAPFAARDPPRRRVDSRSFLSRKTRKRAHLALEVLGRRRFDPVFRLIWAGGFMPMDGTCDIGYQRLFSQPRMVRDLFRGFLPEEWLGWLDLGHPRAAGRRSTARPAGDTLIWRLRWQGGSDWVYLLLKPQGEPDPFTALRLELDRGLLYRALLRRRRGGPGAAAGRAPGRALQRRDPRWAAPLDARELFLPLVPALQRHVPSTRYLVLDAASGPIPPRRPGRRTSSRSSATSSAAGRPRRSIPSWSGWPRCSPPPGRSPAPGLEPLPRLLVPPPPLPRPLRGHRCRRVC